MQQRTAALSSLRVKYMCPDDARTKFDTSPATHTPGKCSSSRSLTAVVTPETVKTLAPSGGGIGFGPGRGVWVR